MWMSIRLQICHGFWIWIFICHSQNEKIKAEIKGSSDHWQNTVENLKEPVKQKDLISSYKNVNGSFLHHRGKALRDT